MPKVDTKAVLYGFWASSCSWRVRAALHYKQIPFEERHIDIVQEKKQLSDEYKAINPMQKVPSLVIGKLNKYLGTNGILRVFSGIHDLYADLLFQIITQLAQLKHSQTV